MRQRQSEVLGYGAQSSIIANFMSKVYTWMMVGIMLTAIVAYVVGSNVELVSQIFSNQVFFWAVIIVQFGSVMFLSFMINRISIGAAAITFMAYSGLTGLTISMIFVLYTQQSITLAFVTTALAFGGLSAYGFMTKRDLGPIGTFLYMALFGLIVLMLLSFLIPSLASDKMQIIYSIVGLVIFSGLTAYDTQRIKAMAAQAHQGMGQLAILGALILYLDFINLFLNLLRLMGDRK